MDLGVARLPDSDAECEGEVLARFGVSLRDVEGMLGVLCEPREVVGSNCGMCRFLEFGVL